MKMWQANCQQTEHLCITPLAELHCFEGRLLFGESCLIYISLYKNAFDS